MRSSKIPDAKLINLFLDMLAAEQGAGANTLDAYRRDITDFSEFLAPTGQGFAGVETRALRDYLVDLDGRGFKSSPENQLHHRQMANHELARSLQRSTR